MSLSPSRASDFQSCPLKYKRRVIEKIPERPSASAVRGTLVHAVLENLFDLPPTARTRQTAEELLPRQWRAMLEADPGLIHAFTDDETWAEERDAGTWTTTEPPGDLFAKWIAEAGTLLGTYFTLEDPARLEPAEREMRIEVTLESGLTLRGIVDRLDRAGNGMLRVVDYKTGKSPAAPYQDQALFQMKFYALAIWRAHGIIPARLQLIYLRDGQILTYDPDESALLATERKVNAIWQAIAKATETDTFLPRPGKLCDWCSFKPTCPAFSASSAEEANG